MKKTILLLALTAIFFSCEERQSKLELHEVLTLYYWEIEDIISLNNSPLYNDFPSRNAYKFGGGILKLVVVDDQGVDFFYNVGTYEGDKVRWYEVEYIIIDWTVNTLTLKSKDVIVQFISIKDK